MKKIRRIFIVFFFLVLATTPVFAVDPSSVLSGEVTEKQFQEARSAEEAELDLDDAGNSKEFDSAERESNKINDAIKTLVDKDNIIEITGLFKFVLDFVYDAFKDFHDGIFGVSGGNVGHLFERLRTLRSGNIFNILLSIFLVLELLYFSIKITTMQNFQYSELLRIAYKVVAVLVFWWLLPLLPEALITIAFRCADIVTGQGDYHADFAAGLLNLGTGHTIASLIAGCLVAAGFIAPEIGVSFIGTANLHFNTSYFQLLGTIVLAIVFVSFFISFRNCLMLLFRGLDFFITNIAMMMVLPAAIFSGFGNSFVDLKNLARYYFVNMVELFLGAIVMIFQGYLMARIETGYFNGVDVGMLETAKTIPYLFRIVFATVVPPIITTILLNATSHILSSLLSGSVSNNNADVSGATSQFMKATGLGMGLSVISQAMSRNMQNRYPKGRFLPKKNKNREKEEAGNNNEL